MKRTWDIFCKLLDNFGDVGVCWRLAADLAARGERVRLWADDRAPLNFMAPHGAPGVEVLHWPPDRVDSNESTWPVPGDVVIETFGCELPGGFIEAMLARPRPPVWLNVEYLGVEDYAERSHGLPSPQANGLPKWFVFPGITPRTGGLLREPGLMEERAAFDRDRWLAKHAIARHKSERVVLLFCYPNAALPAWLDALSHQPTLLLVTPGHAQRQIEALSGSLKPGLRACFLPWLSQAEFDRALWCADINCIRGEDTLVRALWAGAPVLWQLYPQEAEVRDLKLQAWLQQLLGSGAGSGSGTGLAPQSRALHTELLALHRRYNDLDGLPAESPLRLPDLLAWEAMSSQVRSSLLAQDDLVTRLLQFVADKS